MKKTDPQTERDTFRRMVTDDGIRSLAEEIVRGERSSLAKTFAPMDLPPPTIIIDPPIEHLEEPKHRSLLKYWGENSQADTPMPRSAFDPVALRDALGYLILLKATESNLDYEFRVYGTSIAEAAGKDWTGWTVGAMSSKLKSHLGEFYRAVYAACAITRKPIFTEHESPRYLRAASWRRLIVPMADSTGALTWFLVANIPRAIRPYSSDTEAERERIMN